jgi:putative Mg2+ transporter-C (MgtC) family protein
VASGLVIPHVPTISAHETVIRVAMAAGLGALVGLERQARERAAGLRTHILVSMGAAAFTIMSAYGFHEWYIHLEVPRGTTLPLGDPTRIAAQIVTGIGFLGGGVILRSGGNVRGLTTAASIWATAAIGMAVGSGMYFLGLITAIGILFTLVVLRGVNPVLPSHLHHDVMRLRVRVSSSRSVDEVLKAVRKATVDVSGMAIEPVEMDTDDEFLTLEVALKPGIDKLDVSRDLARMAGVVEVHMRDLEDD